MILHRRIAKDSRNEYPIMLRFYFWDDSAHIRTKSNCQGISGNYRRNHTALFMFRIRTKSVLVCRRNLPNPTTFELSCPAWNRQTKISFTAVWIVFFFASCFPQHHSYSFRIHLSVMILFHQRGGLTLHDCL